MSQFLLPCSCGAKLPVSKSQAGMSLQCAECGVSVEVPTIRKLSALALATPETKRAKAGHGLKWLGPVAAISLLVGIIGLSYAGYLFYERREYIAFAVENGANLDAKESDFMADIRKSAEQSAPADTWDYWNTMINDGLKDPNPPDLFKVKRYLESRLPTMLNSLWAGLAGAAVFVGASFLIQQQRKRI
ncbi:MAG: hypothetical protein NTY15_06360 [Planctomycetota bacterium]|nr:hypothetical protein [Planctomycetota bacterium]